MIDVYKKFKEPGQSKRHLMPLSLRYIKVLSAEGIPWQPLHVIDAFSLYCAICIEKARAYLRDKAKERMSRAGVSNISRATESDFDSL